jgi:hypothetical protein
VVNFIGLDMQHAQQLFANNKRHRQFNIRVG